MALAWGYAAVALVLIVVLATAVAHTRAFLLCAEVMLVTDELSGVHTRFEADMVTCLDVATRWILIPRSATHIHHTK